MQFLDSLRNVVSGLGTARDKGAHAQYVHTRMSPHAAYTAYQGSALIRRVIDLPAQDACRDWREWQAEAADITALEAEEYRLGVQGKVLEARRQARLMGGCALIIGDGSITPAMPLVPKAMQRGGLKYLTVVSQEDVSAGPIDRNVMSPTYGLPEYWQIHGMGRQERLHPSRLVIFHGIPPMTGVRYDALQGWGESVLAGGLERVRAVDEVAANILSLVYEAKIDVIGVPDLMMNLQTRGTLYSDEVVRRMTLAATGKGINGTLIKDALETYDQKSASFGGLPEIIDRMMQLASAAYGIPMTLLFGMSAGGLNASGDVDVRGYYDRVRVEQTLHMQPAMRVLDECLIYSALGNHPEGLHYTWRPLWQPTAKERAENGDRLMSALEKLHRMDVVPVEAIGKAAVNGLTESGAFPGLEGSVAEFYAAAPDEEQE